MGLDCGLVPLARLTEIVQAQSGVTGYQHGYFFLKTYVDPVTNMVLVIGGIVGIVGAIRVYSKWNSGDQDINKELMGWGGSCVFSRGFRSRDQSFLWLDLMARRYPIYKGLQKPLIYRGF